MPTIAEKISSVSNVLSNNRKQLDIAREFVSNLLEKRKYLEDKSDELHRQSSDIDIEIRSIDNLLGAMEEQGYKID